MSELGRLYDVADDHDLMVLDELAERAGILRRCPDPACVFTTHEDLPVCSGCGRAMPS